MATIRLIPLGALALPASGRRLMRTNGGANTYRRHEWMLGLKPIINHNWSNIVTNLRLEIVLPGGSTEIVVVDRSPFVLGRQSTCDHVIPVSGVSDEHARFIWNPKGWHIEDLGGKNDTFIDGSLVSVINVA